MRAFLFRQIVYRISVVTIYAAFAQTCRTTFVSPMRPRVYVTTTRRAVIMDARLHH